MNVFISWSGPTSKQVAEALREWLPQVIQAVKPWLSSADIEKGARWFSDIGEQLKDTKVGIICLTTENLSEPWVHFEAGAVSKTVERAHVCPYLFGVDPTNVKGPLAQFQATKAEKDDTKKMLVTINKTLGERALTGDQLNEAFEVWWPKLQEKLEKITGPGEQGEPDRPDHELLKEVLELVRQLAREASEPRVTFGLPGYQPNLYGTTYVPSLSGGPFNAAAQVLGGGGSFRRIVEKIMKEEAEKGEAEKGAAQTGDEKEAALGFKKTRGS